MITVIVMIESDNKPDVVSEYLFHTYKISRVIPYLESLYKHEGYINPKITILETEDNE